MSFPGRTTGVAVAGIIETDPTLVFTDFSGLNPFIDVANELVTECCTPWNGTTGNKQMRPSQAYTPARLELIERWLTAHFYCTLDPRVQMEAAGSVRQSFQKFVGTGFEGSQYGQNAMRIDTLGGLAAKNNKPQFMRDLPIGIFSLGSHEGRYQPRCQTSGYCP
jgi:hypothetical protein